jgi:hypothetical protein
MAKSGVRVQAGVDEYAKFLRDHELALLKHQSYLVRSVRDWGWQYAFPTDKIAVAPADGKVRRFHLHEDCCRRPCAAPRPDGPGPDA